MTLFLVGTAALLLVVAVVSNAEQFATNAVTGDSSPGRRQILGIEAELREADPDPIRPPAEPLEVPQGVTIGLTILAGVTALYLLSRQRISLRGWRPRFRIGRSAKVEVTEEEEADAIADFADDLIHELNAGDSPRIAIQRAYAAVETGFGTPELARKPAETPLRYLARIFGRHKSVQPPLEQLTTLFQQARFSDEPVDESMRSQAVEALTQIGDYYKEFAWNKISNRRSRSNA